MGVVWHEVSGTVTDPLSMSTIYALHPPYVPRPAHGEDYNHVQNS